MWGHPSLPNDPWVRKGLAGGTQACNVPLRIAAQRLRGSAALSIVQSICVGAFDVALSFKLASLSTPCRSIA